MNLGEQSVEVFAGAFGNQIGDDLVRETVSQLGQKITDLLLSQARHAFRCVAKKRNDLFLGAELSFVAHQTFLIDVAQTEIQAAKPPGLTALDSLPNQQIVGPMGKIGGKRGIKFVIQGVFPLQKEIASNDFVLIQSQEKKSMLSVNKVAPDILEELKGLGQEAKFVLSDF